MSSTTDSLTNGRRIACVIGLVFLSIILPIGLAGWTVTSAVSIKPIGHQSRDFNNYYGSAHDGELWFVVYHWQQPWPLWPATPTTSRIERMNLETGIVHETGLEIEEVFGYPAWIGDELYFLAAESIYQRQGDSLVKIGPMISYGYPFNVSPFEWDGRVTTIRLKADDQLCLAHLIDGMWVDGRPIVLPDGGYDWLDDPRLGRKILNPNSATRAGMARPWRVVLKTAKVDQQLHLLLTNLQNFAAYRAGLEFADEDTDVASALATENSLRVVTGWELINKSEPDELWMGISADEAGPLFFGWGRQGHIVRKTSESQWEVLTQLGKPPWKRRDGNYGIEVRSGSAGKPSYALYWNDTWDSAKFSRITGNEVQPPHIVIPECHERYVDWWKHLLRGLLFAWFIHVAVMVLGSAWLMRTSNDRVFEFGLQQVELASVIRRTLASMIDLSLLVAGLVLLCQIAIPTVVRSVRFPDVREIAMSLQEFEWALCYGDPTEGLLTKLQTLFPAAWLKTTVRNHLEIVELIVVGLFGGYLVPALCCEGRSGITPGKWLMGIRMIRSSLRPAGFAAAVVRTVLVCIDVPFCLTPMPAMISMLFSEQRQRIGDRVADTIVIRTKSISVRSENSVPTENLEMQSV